MKTLGQLVKEFREARGWSQAELAERVGVTRGYIGSLEINRTRLPREPLLTKLENTLGISHEDMLRGAGMLPAEGEGYDPVTVLRQIAALPDEESRAAALDALPEELYLLIEAAALDLVRRSFRSGRGQDRRVGGSDAS